MKVPSERQAVSLVAKRLSDWVGADYCREMDASKESNRPGHRIDAVVRAGPFVLGGVEEYRNGCGGCRRH